MKDLRKVHDQILLIMFWKELTKLDCDCFFEYESFNESLIKNKCLSWNQNYLNKMMKNYKNWLNNVFNVSNNDVNKLIL